MPFFTGSLHVTGSVNISQFLTVADLKIPSGSSGTSGSSGINGTSGSSGVSGTSGSSGINGTSGTTPANPITLAAGSPTTISYVWSGTQAQYNALTPNANTLYFIV